MSYLAIDAARSGREGWEWVPLRRVTRLRREPNTDASWPLLALSSERGVEPRPDDGGRQLPSEETVTSYWRVHPNDLVFNPMWAIGGGVAVSHVSGAVSPAYHVYSPTPVLYPRFLHHVMRSRTAIDQYQLLVRGITTFDRSVTREDLGDMPVPVPPLDEQRAIADYLDRETARIDALIAAKERMIALLQERWRVAVTAEMARLAAIHGTIQLRHLIRCLDGRRVPLSAEERAGWHGCFPYYGASAIVDWVDGWLFDEPLVLLGEDGAQLGDPSYPIAQAVSGKIWVNNHAHVLRPVHVDPAFLTLRLNTVDRIPVMSGGTREKITQDDMNRIPVPNIPISHQSEIGSELDGIRARCDGLSATIRRQIALLSERRQALVTAAVTGQVEVPVAA